MHLALLKSHLAIVAKRMYNTTRAVLEERWFPQAAPQQDILAHMDQKFQGRRLHEIIQDEKNTVLCYKTHANHRMESAYWMRIVCQHTQHASIACSSKKDKGGRAPSSHTFMLRISSSRRLFASDSNGALALVT